MNYYKDFFSGLPLKINIPEPDSLEWFRPSISMGDIFSYGVIKHPEFTEHQYVDRILEIHGLIQEYCDKSTNENDFMMCSKELGLPGSIVYLDCDPYIMIDPVFEEVSEEESPTDYITSKYKIDITQFPDKSIIYNIPETITIRYNDINLDEHVIVLSGKTCMRFVLIVEYMTGFYLYRKFHKEILNSQLDNMILS